MTLKSFLRSCTLNTFISVYRADRVLIQSGSVLKLLKSSNIRSFLDTKLAYFTNGFVDIIVVLK